MKVLSVVRALFAGPRPRTRRRSAGSRSRVEIETFVAYDDGTT